MTFSHHGKMGWGSFSALFYSEVMPLTDLSEALRDQRRCKECTAVDCEKERGVVLNKFD